MKDRIYINPNTYLRLLFLAAPICLLDLLETPALMPGGEKDSTRSNRSN